MEILLVVPNSKTHYVVPPIGLGYIATSFKKNEFTVSILDGVKNKTTVKEFGKHIKNLAPKIIGIQTFSFDVEIVKKYVALIKKINKKIHIVLGGAHPSGVGKNIFNDFPDISYAFQGESERSFILLSKKILRNEPINYDDIFGLIRKDGEKVIVNRQDFNENLDDLGIPSWNLMDPRTYPEEPQGGFCKRFPVAPISTSRGCPHLCTYCAGYTISGRKIRLRSIKSVIKEISLLYHEYGVKEIHIVDDTFTTYKKRVYEFCDLLKEKKLDISFTFPNGVRLDTLNEKMLLRMKECGLYAFTVGVESGSQRILDLMKKHLTLKKIREKIDLINQVGLTPNAFFIIGFPGETVEDIKKTIEFAKQLNIKRAHFSNFLPLPGTEATKGIIERGEIRCFNWNELFYAKTPYAPTGINKTDLKKWQRKAFLSFYLRPPILWDLLKEIRSWRHLKSIIKRAKDYLLKK